MNFNIMSIDRLFNWDIDFSSKEGLGENGFIIKLDINSARLARQAVLMEELYKELRLDALELLSRKGYEFHNSLGLYGFLRPEEHTSFKSALLLNMSLPKKSYCLGPVGDIFSILNSKNKNGVLKYQTFNIDSKKDSETLAELYHRYANLAENLMKNMLVD